MENKFKELRIAEGLSMPKLAKKLSEEAGFTIDRQKLGRIEKGQELDAETLKAYCKHFNVSADYLLGLSDVASKNLDTIEINKKLGLNERAIDTLIGYQKNATRKPENAFDSTPMHCKLLIETLNNLLFPNNDLLDYIMLYIYSNFENYYDDNNVSEEGLYQHISEIGFFDKKLGIEFHEDHSFLSSVFLAKAQEELIKMRNIYKEYSPTRITPIAYRDRKDNDPFE